MFRVALLLAEDKKAVLERVFAKVDTVDLLLLALKQAHVSVSYPIADVSGEVILKLEAAFSQPGQLKSYVGILRYIVENTFTIKT